MASTTSIPRISSAGSVWQRLSGSARITASDTAMTSETVAAVAPIAAIVRVTGAGSPDRATTTRYPASTASVASTRPSRPAPMMPRVRMGEETVTSSS